MNRDHTDLDTVVESETEEVLRDFQEKEEFNFALFQYHPSAITVVDRDGCVLKSNLARRHADDALPELGAPLFAGASESEMRMQSELQKALSTNGVREIPEIHSESRIFSYTIAPFTHGAIVIRQDITEQKQAEAQLVQAQKLAALGTLISGVAHEVSNPNNVMLLSLRTLTKVTDQLIPVLDQVYDQAGDFDLGIGAYSEIRDDIPEMVASCYRAAERINLLVSDLKNYSRKDDVEARELFDVSEVAQSAAELMGATIRKTTRRFTLACGTDLPPVMGTSRRIEQVVINLLNNACQALPDRERAISLSTVHHPETDDVQIIVEDEGEGIPAECLSQVTDPFFTTKHDSGGTGLGLSISRQIAENHGGTLVFGSGDHRGTVVTLTLPVYHPN